jgi:ATP-dependent protease HslVU (ClpYQ) peptidase subunit
MTCIVGLVHKGKVYMGADSAGVGGWDLCVRADRKIYRNGEFLFGFTTSFRMGQLLGYAFNPPKKPVEKDLMAFMCTDFIDGVRKCFKDGGFAKKDSEREEGGAFLVGFEQSLFQVHSDYQISKAQDYFDACGCGDQVARGALYANEHLSPRERIKQALCAAEQLSAGVRGPFHLEVL